MSEQGVFFHVHLDRLMLVARQLAEVDDALAGAVTAAAEVDAVAEGNAGFASAAAALACAALWANEVQRLAGRAAAAGSHITDSVRTYELGDTVAHRAFTALSPSAPA